MTAIAAAAETETETAIAAIVTEIATSGATVPVIRAATAVPEARGLATIATSPTLGVPRVRDKRSAAPPASATRRLAKIRLHDRNSRLARIRRLVKIRHLAKTRHRAAATKASALP